MKDNTQRKTWEIENDELQNGMAKYEVFEALADAIGMADSEKEYGLGDRLYNVIIALKMEWGIDLDD